MTTRRLDLERLEVHVKGAKTGASPAAFEAFGRKIAQKLADRIGSATIEPGVLGRIDVRVAGTSAQPDRIAAAIERRVRGSATAPRMGRR